MFSTTAFTSKNKHLPVFLLIWNIYDSLCKTFKHYPTESSFKYYRTSRQIFLQRANKKKTKSMTIYVENSCLIKINEIFCTHIMGGPNFLYMSTNCPFIVSIGFLKSINTSLSTKMVHFLGHKGALNMKCNHTKIQIKHWLKIYWKKLRNIRKEKKPLYETAGNKPCKGIVKKRT